MALNQLLRDHAFIRGFGEDQLLALAAIASPVIFDEDQLILENGSRSEAFYLIASGSVTVEFRTPSFSVSIQSLGPGEAFGWSALLDHYAPLFQVRAREHTLALRLDGTALKQACHSDPSLGTELLLRTLALVAGRVRATEIRFAEMCGVRS